MSGIRSALPSHLKPPVSGGDSDGGEFTQRHHGKTQSHMVSSVYRRLSPWLLELRTGIENTKWISSRQSKVGQKTLFFLKKN